MDAVEAREPEWAASDRRLRRRVLRRCLVGFLAVGLLPVLLGSWIYVKAAVAEVLLHAAWERTALGGDAVRPWPWADMHPVARLRVPSLGVDEIVLSGTSGQCLAFGPGHMERTGLPGGEGNCVIAGHRDTSFRFLARLRPGDVIRLTDPAGRESAYEVEAARVAEEKETGILAPERRRTLTLITCYPFDALLPGPERYVVTARRS